MSTKDITATKIGVLGGGQLGRMLIQAAIDLNLELAIMDPDPEAPCSRLTAEFTIGNLQDYDQVLKWGRDKDLVTIEIEHVNVDALRQLEREGVSVFPQPDVIGLIQDKRAQKQFYAAQDLPTAPFVLTDSREAVMAQADFLPAVNKLGRGGYDGRGVQVIKDASDLGQAFEAPSLLEKFVDFEKELSVIVARSPSDEVNCFPLVELAYHPTQNLVEFLFAPAEVDLHIQSKAYVLAEQVIRSLGMVGLLAVEMFLTRDGELLVNEVAPRVHNSGHHTIEANVTSQFEQHLRAILNLPLGATDLKSPAAMINILGAEGHQGQAKYQGLRKLLSAPGVHVHLYGKKLTKPFRKMGHVTLVDDSLAGVKQKVEQFKNTLTVQA